MCILFVYCCSLLAWFYMNCLMAISSFCVGWQLSTASAKEVQSNCSVHITVQWRDHIMNRYSVNEWIFQSNISLVRRGNENPGRDYNWRWGHRSVKDAYQRPWAPRSWDQEQDFGKMNCSFEVFASRSYQSVASWNKINKKWCVGRLVRSWLCISAVCW